MIYKPKHFRLEELVSAGIFSQYGEFCWQFLSPLALISLDHIREHFDAPVTVNDWLWRKNGFQYRGLRSPGSNVGALMSQHRFGRAFDLDVKGYTAEEVREVILSNSQSPVFYHINCLEEDVSWVHFDCRNLPDEKRIKIVRP